MTTPSLKNKFPVYVIDSSLLMVADEESVSFRVKNNDYFGTAATIISLVRQTAKTPPRQNLALKNIEDDLKILQKKYRIIAE